jgi:hypothetical protein
MYQARVAVTQLLNDGRLTARHVHATGRRNRTAGTIHNLYRSDTIPVTDYRPLGMNSSRMRVEPGQDLVTFPAVVLANLVERRPSSLAGVPVQRRLLDLQQCADFLGRQDLVSHRMTQPFVPLCQAYRSPPRSAY